MTNNKNTPFRFIKQKIFYFYMKTEHGFKKSDEQFSLFKKGHIKEKGISFQNLFFQKFYRNNKNIFFINKSMIGLTPF
ncbi:MAG: hypothetical protein D6734_01085 [Candidatus Schekmanbacteria bacterium]|nr:MAG: hypothetical protein D6734_01085 [Candidatus Schekmanbacteria bacterium]